MTSTDEKGARAASTGSDESTLYHDRGPTVSRWGVGAVRSVLDLLRKIMRTRSGSIGLVVVGVYIAMAIIGPTFAPYSATELNIPSALEGPSSQHWFGTDQYGRDTFSRVVTGARRTLLMAVAAMSVGVIGGVFIGLVSGYYGKHVDEVIMRIVDAFYSFPALLLALLIVTTLGSSAWTVLLAIGVVFIPRAGRVARAATLEVRTQEFVEAARLRGESGINILVREILPNITAPISVEASIRMSYAILLTTSLSFLGLGAQPPTPDWGLMVAESREYISQAPSMVIFPALAISFLIVGVNLFGDGVREVLHHGSEEGAL